MSQNITSPFTGKQNIEDTCVYIPISSIRAANNKLIERKYLINIVEAQDSIICLQDSYILNQDSINDILKDRIIKTNELNNSLQKQYEKEQKKKIIYGSVAGACMVGIVTTIVTTVLIYK